MNAGTGSEARPLQGLTIAVTRPSHQAEPTCRTLAAGGADVIRFPVMEIAAAPPSPDLAALAGTIADFELALFISANAVHFGLELLRPTGGLPTGLRVAAVGRATAKALAQAGVKVDICPGEGFDSEALLAMPELAEVRGQDIVLFRGVGGRELLADRLRAQGAKVHYAEVYRRVRASTDIEQLAAHWRAQSLDLIVVTSGDGLRFLLDCAGATYREPLLRTPLAVIGVRMLQQARDLGFQSDIVVTEPGEQALLAALTDWRRDAHRQTVDRE